MPATNRQGVRASEIFYFFFVQLSHTALNTDRSSALNVLFQKKKHPTDFSESVST